MTRIVYGSQRYVVSFLLFVVACLNGCAKPLVENPAHTEAKLAEIQALMDAGKVSKAAKLSTKLVKDYPSSVHLEKALLFQGDSLYAKGDYYQAYEAYEKVLNQFGSTDRFVYVIERETDIAHRFLAGEKRRFWKIFWIPAAYEGLKILDDIDAHWPGSEAGAKAVMMRGDYYFRKEKYFEAEQEYHRIVISYDKSSFFKRAMYQEAQSKYLQYEGIYYDSICLDEAVVLYEEYKDRFPEKAAELKVDERIAWIKDQKVRKEYEIADYYYRTGRLPQAILYWQSIIEMAPSSEFSQKAIENINKAQGKL